MKNSTSNRKRIRLPLGREAIRHLQAPDLEQARGGLPKVIDTCDMGPASCETTK